MFPDPGGLLPWGMNSNHTYCCWMTTGSDPGQWPVAVFRDFRGVGDGEVDHTRVRPDRQALRVRVGSRVVAPPHRDHGTTDMPWVRK